MKKTWQKHRDKFVAISMIFRIMLTIISLNLQLADFKEKPTQDLPVQTETKCLNGRDLHILFSYEAETIF